jgi:regulator of replication initiation timing
VKDGKSEIQALRYDKSTWTADAARSHCQSRDGSFEAASEEKESMTEVIKHEGDKWVLYSADGSKKLGEFDSEEDAIKREKQIQYFKHQESDIKESLRQRHSEIIQELGRRNASADAGRIKKIMELCQELLSSEPTEEKTTEALKEADSVLAWLREQPIVKTEDSIQYPASAFAYVPDSQNPSTWRVRLQETSGKVTTKQLEKCANYISPGGHKGELPFIALAEVKRRIRSEYRKLGIEEDMPRWVKEAELRTLLTNYIPLTEAKLDKGLAMITVIKAGFNESKDRYYPLDTLCRDYSVFEGLKMYADHPSEDDERNRPERSIRDWVATLKNVHMEKDTVVGEAQIIEPWMQEKLATLRDKGMLKDMGVSINAVGAATEATIEGVKTSYIERITRGRSVDFVTEAGAGGLVQMYEAEKDVDIDFVSLSTLKERRPDLVKEIETSVKNTLMKEVKKTMELEEQVKELTETNATLTQENTNLKTEKETAEKASRIAEAKALVDKALGEADLPAPAKARILERFKDAEKADGLEEAITAEQAYIAAISETGKVKGMGGASPDPEADKKALRESWKKLHPEYTEAQLEVAISGR